MKPSDTVRATGWLGQFEPDDRGLAKDLLDSIRIPTLDQISNGVQQVFRAYLESEPRKRPVAAVPVLSKEDMTPLHPGSLPALPVVFRDFDPSQKLSGSPGSEATVAQIIRQMQRATDLKSNMLKHPLTMEALRSHQVRTVVCLTDFIGSGEQVNNYIEAWHRHPTMRSWRSYGLLSFAVIAFATTKPGYEVVNRNPHVDLLLAHEIAPDIRSSFTPEIALQVERLCQIYASRGNLRLPLGYAASGSLFATPLSVPNNLPAILIRGSRRWTPFFDRRAMPDATVSDFTPEHDTAGQLSKLNESRLVKKFAAGDRRWSNWLIVLKSQPASDPDVATIAGITITEVTRAKATLRRLGLIDDRDQPTEAGIAAIRRARIGARHVSARLRGDPNPYYPRLKG